MDADENPILAELETIRAEIQELKNLQLAAIPVDSDLPSSIHTLEVFVSRIGGERKPFALRIEGPLSIRVNISAVRAAILLVILLDLEDRCDGGKGVIDPLQAIADAYASLHPATDSANELKESLRVAIYRFANFVEKTKFFEAENFKLLFDSQSFRLNPSLQNIKLSRFLSVRIQTSDAKITKVLDDTLLTSPLARLRKEKGLYLPGGADGIDKLVLDIFDHKFPASQVSLYHRPSFQSFPIELLEKIGVSDRKLRRARVLLEGYDTGRCSFTEILSRQSIWELIHYNEEKGWKRYPKQVTIDDVLQHLKYFETLLERYERYSLVLTDAFIPFHLATYQIDSGPRPEYFTLFLRRFSDSTPYDETSFAVEGLGVYKGVTQKLVSLLHSHPSTMTDRDRVASEVRKIAEHLKTEGTIRW